MRWRTLRAPLSSWLHSAARYGQTSSLISSSRPAQRGPLHHLPQLPPCDLGKVVLREWTEGRDAVDTPQKLRRERLPKNSFCPVLRAAGREADTVFHRFSASQIGGHDDHGVLEVHRPAERIRQDAVLYEFAAAGPVTSRCAFSSSSSSTTLYGRRRTFSVSVPASSWPM